MDRLPNIRVAFQKALRDNADVFYRHTGNFVLCDNTWTCRFSVEDPPQLKIDEVAKLRMFADTRQLIYTSLRLLKVHPDDTSPFPGATLPWDDGTLEVLDWSQESDFTGLRVGTCVLRRP